MVDMRYTTLGHSDITIPRLCLGGMSFGKPSADFHQWTIGLKKRVLSSSARSSWV